MRVRIYMCAFRRLIHGRALKGMRFTKKKDENGTYFQRNIDDNDNDELKKVRKYCLRHFLRFTMTDVSMFRDSSYRARFFRENKGIFGKGNYYLCAYCGRLLNKDKVRVDHIIPVYLAIHSQRHKRMLALRGIHNVNAAANLAPSCAACNGKKGSSGGLWIPRGYFGRSWIRVFFSRVFLLLAAGIGLYYLYGFLVSTGMSEHIITLWKNITALFAGGL